MNACGHQDRFPARQSCAGNPLAITCLLLLCLLSACAGERGITAEQVSLTEVKDFGAPGTNLRMFEYIPQTAGPSPPMVVVLHHCLQNAADYLLDSGWREVADHRGIVLLLPQESMINNPIMCFNFHIGTNQSRDSGEPGSIHHMIEYMIAHHGVDPHRIFATGLSSGGSMSVVMLSLYPEIFAGGGAVGSISYGCAQIAIDVVPCMIFGDLGFSALSSQGLADRVRRASNYQGPWPRLQVWEGSGDVLTMPFNAHDIVRQWTWLHGVQDVTPEETVDGPAHIRTWRDASGQPVVQLIMVEGIGHSLPIDQKHGCGNLHLALLGGWVNDIGICASEWMARFWGLPLVPAKEPAPPGS